MRGQLGGSLALLGFVLTFGLAGTLLATWDCLCNLHADRIVASRKSLPIATLPQWALLVDCFIEV